MTIERMERQGKTHKIERTPGGQFARFLSSGKAAASVKSPAKAGKKAATKKKNNKAKKATKKNTKKAA